jgi:hypothetical protein
MPGLQHREVTLGSDLGTQLDKTMLLCCTVISGIMFTDHHVVM